MEVYRPSGKPSDVKALLLPCKQVGKELKMQGHLSFALVLRAGPSWLQLQGKESPSTSCRSDFTCLSESLKVVNLF